jgi:CRP-like cAMP-binding protein
MQQAPKEGLIKLIQSIELFKGFNPQEVSALLRIAKSKKCDARRILYDRGEPSTEMLILTSGSLVVQTEQEVNVATITPGQSVGELGVMTDAPRSARVIAVEDSSGLALQKSELMSLLKSDKDICIKFQANLINLLARRLRDTDVMVDRFAKEKSE